MTDSKTVEHYLRTIEEEGRNLNKWEQDFVESVREQFDERGTVSDKQEEILERIYTDKTQ